MARVIDQIAVIGPLKHLNEMFKAGVHDGVKQLAEGWGDVKSRAAADDWQFDMNSFDDSQMDHIKNHWLGVGDQSWFPSADAAPVLEEGFAHALKLAGDRPVSSVWVPAESFDAVTVSVIENPTSVVVVLTSPMPPKGAATSGRDGNVTEFSAPCT